MKIEITFGTDEKKADDFLRYLGDCITEWNRPENDVKLTSWRKCIRCGKIEETTLLRGRFLCVGCKNA